MRTSSRPSAVTYCVSPCPRFVSTRKESAVHREEAVRAAKAAQIAVRAAAAALKTVVRAKTRAQVKIRARLKIRADPARSAARKEARPELMRAADDPARATGAHRYGCCGTGSWFRCGCARVLTTEH